MALWFCMLLLDNNGSNVKYVQASNCHDLLDLKQMLNARLKQALSLIYTPA